MDGPDDAAEKRPITIERDSRERREREEREKREREERERKP